jgi:hypothetical protein
MTAGQDFVLTLCFADNPGPARRDAPGSARRRPTVLVLNDARREDVG